MPHFKKLALLVLVVVLLAATPVWLHLATLATPNQPSMNVTPLSQSSSSIHITFSEAIPRDDIVDVEVFDSSNNKVAQNFSSNGGTDFDITVQNIPNGKYFVSVGLFTPNWASNYAWFDKFGSFDLPNNSVVTTSNAPAVTATQVSPGVFSIALNFKESIQKDHIVDVEVKDKNNQKVWQTLFTQGGTSFTGTTSNLPVGEYTVSVGLFTPNWTSNYAWFDALVGITSDVSVLSTPTPSTPQIPNEKTVNSNSFNASTFYAEWKSKYVRDFEGGLRVIRPENNNDTVSEGIGYGMVIAALAGDKTTFDGLWKYGQRYLDSKGLMHWQIDSGGKVIGSGSATDADEDMAYALILAHKAWPGNGYDVFAKRMINAILAYDVNLNNYVNPGDNWGNTPIINPSYIAPSYYREFARFTGESRWDTIASQNSAWLVKIADQSTGLLPDWKNADGSDADIPFDAHKNNFYYDASRAPIRLLLSYRYNGDENARLLLQKQLNFFNKVGVENLKSGYTLSGVPLSDYLDTTFLSAYAAAGQVQPNSEYATRSLSSLTSKKGGGYFGDTLRTWLLLALSQ